MGHRALRRLLAGSAILALSATAAIADHSWGNYHWAMYSNPVPVRFDENLTSEWEPWLTQAVADWNSSDKLTLSIATGTANPRQCRAVNGRVQVCNAAYGFNGWLGIAQIWVGSGSHITQGVVKLNDSYFRSGTYNTPAWRDFVMCQEVGHIFGLDHQDEDFYNPNLGTCMDYTNGPSRNDGQGDNLAPNQHDYGQLNTIYTSHGDVKTTSATKSPFDAPPAGDGSSAGGETPGEWGRAVAFTADGRGRVYVRELGGGRRMVTFVTRTLERAREAH